MTKLSSKLQHFLKTDLNKQITLNRHTLKSLNQNSCSNLICIIVLLVGVTFVVHWPTDTNAHNSVDFRTVFSFVGHSAAQDADSP